MIQIIAILCLAAYGAIISLLVGLKLEIAERYRINDSKVGLVFSSFMLAGAIGVIFLSALIDVFGHKAITIFGFAFTAVALFMLANARSFRQTMAMYVLMSIGTMCIISVGNTILPLVLFGGENASAATNLGNAFYGVGAFFVSYFLTDFLSKYGYRKTVAGFGLLMTLIAILSLFAEYPTVSSRFSFSDLPEVLTSSFFLIALIANFFGAGVENGVGSWANTFMVRLGSSDKQANSVLSLFFIAVLVSRLVTAIFVTPENTPVVLLWISCLAVAVLVIMIVSANRILGIVGVIAMGLLMGSVCPNIFGYMFSKIDPAYHGTSFGILFAMGLAGGSVIPGLVGIISRKRNFRFGFVINVAGALLLGVSAIIMMTSCTKPADAGLSSDGESPVTEHVSVQPITMESLLDEMVSFEESVYYPSPFWTSSQLSSTDKRSISPDQPYWFGNQDNTRYVRIDNDNADRRLEKVIFDKEGPGVITRIWTAGNVTDVTIRFYFDGERTPRLSVKGNDFTKVPFHVPNGLVYRHLHYDKYGGTSLHVPLPYSERCKITIDNPDPEFGFAYHIGYRTYESGTDVRTFTVQEANSLASKMDATADMLMNPEQYSDGLICQTLQSVDPGESVRMDFPEGTKAIRNLKISVNGINSSLYDKVMRNLIITMKFDGANTVHCPLGDFSGGGIGAKKVDSWYLSADGEGTSECRFIMPWKDTACLEIKNLSSSKADIRVEAIVSDWKWHANTCYFHCSWRQERGLQTSNDYDSNDNSEWLFSHLTGGGVVKADILSLYNFRDTWYGEGDEKIYIDNDIFPSHFGTGTEDYYNTSFAPVKVFQTPLGGAVRADTESSFGYNTWLRSRNLDGLTFQTSLKFYFELLGWAPATVLYSSTVFWYGLHGAKAEALSGEEEMTAVLPD